MIPRMKARAQEVRSTNILYVACIVQICICAAIISFTCPGDRALELGGVLISPMMQWYNTTFNALCIPFAIVAAIGSIYHIDIHLVVYIFVLWVSIVVDVCWCLLFLVYGTNCKTKHDPSHRWDSVTCKTSSSPIIMIIGGVILFKFFLLFAVSKARRRILKKQSEKMLPHLLYSFDKRFNTNDMEPEWCAPVYENGPGMGAAPGYEVQSVAQPFSFNPASGAPIPLVPAASASVSNQQHYSAPACTSAAYGSMHSKVSMQNGPPPAMSSLRTDSARPQGVRRSLLTSHMLIPDPAVAHMPP